MEKRYSLINYALLNIGLNKATNQNIKFHKTIDCTVL